MTITYILVDFDNVKPTAADVGLVHGDRTRLAVVRGPQQTRYEADLAEALHTMGDRVTFTRCAKAGKNAADMQIAFLLGGLIAALPPGSHKGARFIVISKDKDFDPLVAYLQGQGFDAARAPSFRAALGGKGAEAAARPRAGKSAASTARPTPAKVPAKKAAARKSPAAKKVAPAQPAEKKAAHAVARTASKRPAAPDALTRVIEGLQRKGDERPGKRKGLERLIESHLGRNLAPGQLDALIAQLERDGAIVFHDNKVEYRLPKPKK